MLFFDQLKKNDTQLQLLAIVIFSGLAILLAGLWWVQVVRARDYQTSSETQASRTVRLPSVRGKILDRNGVVLAENRANFNISVYLEDLSKSFKEEYSRLRPTNAVTSSAPFWKRWLGFGATVKPVPLKPEQYRPIEWQARFLVMNQVVQQLASGLQISGLALNTNDFIRHYTNRLALPYPILKGASITHIARFQEQLSGNIAADLEIQSTRHYPFSNTAAHVLGYLRRDDDRSTFGEDATFSYRLPDFRGVVGIEAGFDEDLCGRAGTKSVVVNNRGYRQTESITSPAEAGHNVVLTLDLKIQREAEAALHQHADGHFGAVVVMDVESGDILALASTPASDPNYFITRFPPGEYQNWTNEAAGLQKNRATREVYQPGSTFKPIIALAALENGLNPDEIFHVEQNPSEPGKGAYFVGKQKFRDTVSPGPYNLRRALVKSSNAYFINAGLRPGVFPRVVKLAHQLHLGETNGLPLRQEGSGHFPDAERLRSDWNSGETANISIGQGAMDVTPVQMAVLTCALANGGKVLWPRLVSRLEPQDPVSVEPPTAFPAGRIRDHLGVSSRYLQIVRDAMVAETEDNEGTGQHAHLAGLRICGKTGTAERTVHGAKRNTTWFISFAPYEAPARYAVVVMAEDGASGGGTCAPVARDIYKKLFNLDQPAGNRAALTSTR
jgi:penicillin-binding protein 2